MRRGLGKLFGALFPVRGGFEDTKRRRVHGAEIHRKTYLRQKAQRRMAKQSRRRNR